MFLFNPNQPGWPGSIPVSVAPTPVSILVFRPVEC